MPACKNGEAAQRSYSRGIRYRVYRWPRIIPATTTMFSSRCLCTGVNDGYEVQLPEGCGISLHERNRGNRTNGGTHAITWYRVDGDDYIAAGSAEARAQRCWGGSRKPVLP